MMSRPFSLLFFLLISTVEVIAQKPAFPDLFPSTLDNFRQEHFKIAREILKNGNIKNGRNLKSFDNHKFLEDDGFILDSTITYLYESPVDSIPSYKSISESNVGFTFDIDMQHWVKSDSFFTETINRYSEYISYRWDGESANWIPVFRSEEDYNDQNVRYFIASYNWSEEKESWIGQTKKVLATYEDGTTERDTTFVWDEINQAWVGEQLFEYLYYTDPSIFDINAYIYRRETKNWELVFPSRFKLVKSEKDDLITTISHLEVDGEWVLYSKQEIMHDKFGNISFRDEFLYDRVSNSWEMINRREKTAIGYSLFTLEINYSWNKERGELIPYNKYVRDFDDRLRPINEFIYEWDAENEEWGGIERTEKFYENEGNYLHTNTSFYWNADINSWIVESKKFFYYHQEEVISDVKDYGPQGAILFPNPILNGELSIRLEKENINEILIFSASGKMLDKISTFRLQSVNVSFPYPNGIYFVKINTDKGITTHKVVK